MTIDRDVFLGLVQSLPDRHGEELMGFWDIGEQEAALGALLETLIELQVPIDELVRAQIAILAEKWGVWNGSTTAGRLAACVGADEGDLAWRLVEGTERGDALQDALQSALPDEVHAALRPGHPLHGVAIVAWFACCGCDDVLVRVHQREDWGLSTTSSQYAVIQSPASAAHATYAIETFTCGFKALGALNALACGGPTTIRSRSDCRRRP